MKQKNLVLMVVAVGCGLVAAFLTSQMSGKTPVVEKIEVLVAAKDIPVGTMLTKDDLKTAVKRKTISKDAVPPTIVETEEELIEKRVTRTIRAEEMINKADVTRGSVVSIPPGMSMVSLPINLAQAVTGFVGPGSKVDVLATVRLQNKITALPILVNMLVLAVDANTNLPGNSAAFQQVTTVSFAVDRKQALLIKLATARGCDMSLLLRNPDEKVNENDLNYDIDKVVKLLSDERNHSKIADDDEPKNSKKDDPASPEKSVDPSPAPEPTPKTVLVKVPAAAVDIPAGTQITNDLIAEKFKLIELPKDVADEAVTDLAPLAETGEVLRTGLGKGQWVTRALVGRAELKPSPRSEFEPKPGFTDPPAKPTPTVEAKKTHDVSLHTAAGTKVFRYEETAPGEWKLLGEVRSRTQAVPQAPTKPAPGATPEKTVD